MSKGPNGPFIAILSTSTCGFPQLGRPPDIFKSPTTAILKVASGKALISARVIFRLKERPTEFPLNTGLIPLIFTGKPPADLSGLEKPKKLILPDIYGS